MPSTKCYQIQRQRGFESIELNRLHGDTIYLEPWCRQNFISNPVELLFLIIMATLYADVMSLAYASGILLELVQYIRSMIDRDQQK